MFKIWLVLKIERDELKRRGYVGQAKYTILSGTLYSSSLTKSLKRALFDTEDRSCKNA